jgi:hypothetical protein
MPAKGKRQRGTGYVFQPTYTDRNGVKRKSRTWWYAHPCRCCPGRKHREGGFDSKADARAELNLRLGQIARGKQRFLAERETLEMLLHLVLTDYEVNGRVALPHARRRARFLIAYFGAGEKAARLTPDRLMEYVAARQHEGAANATINHELGLLRHAFVLAIRHGRLDTRPYIPRLKPAPPRSGMFQREAFDLVLAQLDGDLRPLFEAAYITGWRCKSELTTRQWRHVEFGPEAWTCGCKVMRGDVQCEDCGRYRPGWIRLEPGETKNGLGRQFPMIPSLRAILDEQRRRTDELERATGQVVPWVFWRAGGSGVLMAGSPIRSYHRAWSQACAKAGVKNIPHDMRRTAVVHLDRQGVSRTVGKQITGHKTDRIYEQYGVPEAENMLRAGAALENLLAEQTTQPKRVIAGSFGARKARARK